MTKNSHDYGYATGYVRSLQGKLLNTSQQEQMLDSSDAHEAYRILNDTDLADAVAEYSAVADFESAIQHSMLYTKKEMTFTAPNDLVLQGLWTWYDVYNLKVAFKAFATERSFEQVEAVFSPYGSIDKTIIRDFVWGELQLAGYEGVKIKVLEAFTKYENVQHIDFVLDQELFTRLLTWAEALQSELLIAFVQQRIDTANVFAYLRLSPEQRSAIGKYIFAEGGTVAPGVFLAAGDEGRNKAVLIFGEEAVEEIESKNHYQSAQKQGDDLLMKFVKQARFISEGPEVLVAYWWARQKEAEVVRSILSGKMSGLDNEVIRKYLPELY